MTEASAAEAPRYNERSQTRASVIGRWVVLVPGCAIPLVVAAWHSLSAQELAGIGGGIATWTVAMVCFHVWRLTAGRYGDTTRLTLAATILMASEWLLLAAASSIALLVVFSPAAMLVGAVVPGAVADVEPLMAYVVTIACGAQAFVCVVGITWVMERLHFWDGHARR